MLEELVKMILVVEKANGSLLLTDNNAVFPWNSGRPVMKSIAIWDQGLLGIGMGWRRLVRWLVNSASLGTDSTGKDIFFSVGFRSRQSESSN